MLKKSLYLLLFVFLIGACKSSKNQFEKGNYAAAVEISIKKLRKKASNKKEKAVLKSAYTLAVQLAERKVMDYKSSQNRFKWDDIIREYTQMQRLYTELMQCPGCLTEVELVNYQSQLNEALNIGAQVYVEEGQLQLEQENKEAARQAFRYFVKAKSYKVDYLNIDNYIGQARAMGTEVIGITKIPVRSKGLEVNNRLFSRQLLQRLNNMNFEFAQFYDVEELRNQRRMPDQIVELSFDDYYVGQVYLKETRETVSKDSVRIGKAKDSLGNTFDVYGTVEADLRIFSKTIESGGLLDVVVVNPNTDEVLLQQKIPSTYAWINEWATYKGDKRALNKEELSLTRERELLPPQPQEMFEAFAQPLQRKATNLIRRRYRYLNN